MTELSDIDRLRKGEKILCHTCHKHYYWKMHPKKKSSRMWVAYKRQKLNEVKGVYLG